MSTSSIFIPVPRASGVKVDLFVREGEQMTAVKSVLTDADGRSGTLLAGDMSDYFKATDKTLPADFFRKLSLEFEVTDPTVPHHIPLQCTPWTQAFSVLPG